MSKKIIISAITSTVLAGSLFAGTASSTITAGTDISGNAHSSATNVEVAATTSTTKDGNNSVNSFITYIPNIGIGEGNLITIEVTNGGVVGNALNKLWLTDSNSTGDQNVTGAPIVATMTDFVSYSQNNKTWYSKMTFKFDETVDSNHNLVLVNNLDTNTSYTADNKQGLGYRTSDLLLSINNGSACGDNVKLRVIDSKDQSGSLFDVANSSADATALNLVRGVTIAKGNQADTAGTGHIATDSTAGNNGDETAYTSLDCPTYECTISVAQNDLNFGTSGAASTATCPTCSDTGTTTDYTCVGSFILDYATGYITGGGTTITTLDLSTDGKDTTAIKSIVAAAEANTATKELTNTTGTAYTGSLGTANGVVATDANTTVVLTYTVDGTTVINPRTFDLNVKINTSQDIDTITNFLKLTEGGSELKVSYLSANPDYRSIVRVTSSSAAAVEATITTEDGATSTRFDTGFSIGSNGGAVVVDGATLLSKAQAAGFTGTGMRFNATLFVKTTGTVDAVAYQTAGTSGSQRYLPVAGATGGGTK